jgi:DNA polymerase-1
VAALSEKSKLDKLLSTFISPVVTKAKEQDGYINTSYNQCETRTTRLSSSNPNLQNIPSRSLDGKRIRECFTAPKGYSLVIGDLSSIEVRILAVLLEDFVGDSRVADAIRRGDDIHAINQAAWGMESRSPTKNGFFALVYGAWLNRFALTIDKPVSEARKFFDLIRKDYSVLFDKLMPKVWKVAAKKRGYYVYTEAGRKSRYGFVYSLLGHRYHYEDITSDDHSLVSAAKRESFNAVIQGTGAGLFKLLTLRGLRGAPVDIFPCAVVHDELICLVRDEDAEVGAAHLTKVFSEYMLSNVPIQAVFNVVDNWSLK